MLNIKLKMEFKISQKGAVSLYLALMTMIILLAIGLGITTIIISQMRMIRGMGDSVVAFHAADTGIERILYEDKMCYQATGCPSPPCKTGCFGLMHNAEFFANLGDANYVVNHEICPDLNGDGIVDMLDASVLSAHWGETPASPNWDPKCDLNGDGIVDLLDAGVLSNHWGDHCRGYNIYKSSGEFKRIKRAIEVVRKDP